MALSLISLSSLYNLCLERVAKLLKSNVWDIRYEFNNDYENPFAQVPSIIIDDLVARIFRLSSSPLKPRDLYHLIDSGQIRNFQMEDIEISSDDFLCILFQLSSKCENLITVKIRNTNVIGLVGEVINRVSHTLEFVLSLAPRLESVNSCIEFDLKCLRNAEYLKELRLYFVPKSHLFDFLKQTDGQLCPNNSLKILEIYQYEGHTPSYLDIAVILKHCNKLVETNCNISKSLEHLHLAELQNGTLTSQYTLEKCNLGNIFNDCIVTGDAISRQIVSLAEITCPNLREIKIALDEESTIYALSNFKYLTSLTIIWISPVAGNFQLGTTSLLEKIGPNLIKLHISNLGKVDFSSIGNLCPKLEILSVVHTAEWEKIHGNSYRNLRPLYIGFVSRLFYQSDSLVCVQNHCTNREHLLIEPAGGFTDELLKHILDKNSFLNLKVARMYETRLSAHVEELLATKATSLEFYRITSSEVSFHKIVAAVCKIKPRVEYSPFDLFLAW